jgi:hypothetical protein
VRVSVCKSHKIIYLATLSGIVFIVGRPYRASQLAEITPFRLTRPFDLAYTRFTASLASSRLLAVVPFRRRQLEFANNH